MFDTLAHDTRSSTPSSSRSKGSRKRKSGSRSTRRGGHRDEDSDENWTDEELDRQEFEKRQKRRTKHYKRRSADDVGDYHSGSERSRSHSHSRDGSVDEGRGSGRGEEGVPQSARLSRTHSSSPGGTNQNSGRSKSPFRFFSRSRRRSPSPGELANRTSAAGVPGATHDGPAIERSASEQQLSLGCVVRVNA